MSVVELSNVTLVRGKRLILDNLSWRVEEKAHAALIGPNSAGKTTLLRVINGYIWPTRGRVRVLGKLFGSYDLRQLREEIGFVSSHLVEWVPPGEKTIEVVLSGKFSSIELWVKPSVADVRRATKLLEFLDCGSLSETPYGILSQGEKQKVLIARALMSEPKLLVLDEPCAGLDLAARENFLRFLQKIGEKRRGPTMIFVTHHVDEIGPPFQEALLIRDGRKVAEGHIERVLTSVNLTRAFSVPVDVIKRNGRHYTMIE